MASKLTPRDKQLLKAGNKFRPGTAKYEGGVFGANGDDYVLLSVIEPATNRIIITKELEPNTINDDIVCKPGIDIRALGFASGRFRFRYEFFRRIAGSDDVVLVRSDFGHEGEIYNGPYYINSDNEFLSGGPNQPDSFELIPTKLNYEIKKIGNSRDEVRIRARNINDDIYKENLFDRGFAFKTFISDEERRRNTNQDPKLRFYNPFNPGLPQGGFNAASGPPPDDDTSSTHIILEDGGSFRFRQIHQGATLRVKDAFLIAEQEDILLTERNIVSNPSGDTIIFDDALNPLLPTGVYDTELHTDAITVEAWSTGVLGYQNPGDPFYGTGPIGYHAKWVRGEGRNGGQCMKFVDRNAIYRNDTAWPSGQGVHRPLVISAQLPAISNYGVNPGTDLFYITYFQKASSINKGASISIKYGSGFGLAEPRPTNPPEGYHVPGEGLNDAPLNAPDGYLAEPGETKPSGELIDGQGAGVLSPNKQWYISSIQNGLYVWEPNYDKFNLETGDEEGVLGIRRVGTEDPGSGNPETTWVWRGSTWTPKFPPDIPGCTDPSALNYQSYADSDNGTCVFEQSILPSTGDFDVVFKCRHKENFNGFEPWNTFSGTNSEFFLKYDETLQDYHIWQSRFGGSENAVNYSLGIATLFGNYKQKANYILGTSAVMVAKASGNMIGDSPLQQAPGLLTLMTKFGKIQDISEYHRYGSGYVNKRKGLIVFISFNQDYRDYLEDEKGVSEDQAQGIVVECRTDDGPGPQIVGINYYTREDGKGEVEVGERDLGTLDELKHAVFEDRGNKDNPRFWLLGDTGTPARTKTASGPRIIDPYTNNDDYFEYWYGQGLGSFQAIFGNDGAEKFVGISGDQVYATELNAKGDGLPGYPKPLSDIYPGVGEKDLYVNRGCANPFANNYGEIFEGENAGSNPVDEYRASINDTEVGSLINWPLGHGGRVQISNQNRNRDVLAGRAFDERTKASMLSILDAPTYTQRRALNIPNIDGGNCDFSVSNDPLKNGTLSPGGAWKWNGPDAVWEYQGTSPAAITFESVQFESEPVTIENDWEQVTGTAEIPANILINEPMELVVEGHRVGGTEDTSTQGIVWVDDIDLRFQKPDEVSTRQIFADYIGVVKNVENDNLIRLDKSFDQVGEEVGALSSPLNDARSAVSLPSSAQPGDATRAFNNFELRYRVNDEEELRTYIEVRGEKYLTTNFKQHRLTEPNYPHAVDFKLYNPLDTIVSKFDGVKIMKEMALPYEDEIDLLDYVPREINGLVLLSPKLEDSESPVRPRQVDFADTNTLLTSDNKIKEKLQDQLLSGSIEEVELNVEYQKGFSEFVHFSSAKKRLSNFRYKLKLIESYTQESASAASLTQASYGNEKKDVDVWNDRIRNVKNGFDGFEKYMYEQSSSAYTSSMGTFYENTWPKVSGAGTMASPYVLAHTTSSQAINWYNEQEASGSEYDMFNGNNLINNIPEFVNTSENQAYLDFIKMMGQYFDKIYLFIREMGQINDRRSSISEGLGKQLYYSVAKSLGWNLSDGKDLVDLPNFILGQRASGSNGGFEEIERTEQDISREIWSRIISNMPYFLKNKGTVRALKGLINCYGIPSSILRVKEYGGPDTPSSINFEINRKFTKALGFRSGQKVDFNWQIASASVAGDTAAFPDTIEWRFKAPKSQDQWLWSKRDSSNRYRMGAIMRDNGSLDNIGSVLFFLSGSKGNVSVSSSNFPIYDNEFYSAMVRRTTHSASIDDNVAYNLVVKKYDAGIDRFQYVSSEILQVSGAAGAVSESYNQSWDSHGTFSIGGHAEWSGVTTGSLDFNGNAVPQMSGAMMEYRIWTEPLNTGSFDNHANNPKAYDGNTISSSYEAIVSRYSFDDDKNLQADTLVRDVSAKTTEVQNATAVGFTGNTFESVVDRTKSLVPNLGPSKVSSNKVRIEDNIIRPEFRFISGSDGEYRELQSEVPIGRGRHDFAPTDSNKVAIYFSPTDAINQDIIESLANINFDNYLGDPRDRYGEEYRGLEAAQDKYWLKYNAPFNFWQYLKLLKTYDQSIFPQLKKLVPARANARFGILVEPNILERAKEVMGKAPSFDNRYYESVIHMSESYYSLNESSSEFGGAYGQPYSPSTDTHFDDINKSITWYNNHDPSSSAIRLGGENKYFQGILSQSRLENFEHSVFERQGTPGDIYASASVTFGDTFKDQASLQPIVSGSRINPLKSKIKLFYSSQFSASMHMPSSFSYEAADINVPAESSTAMRRLFFEGIMNTKLTTHDGLEPVEVKLTSPTRIVTKEPGDSKLDIE